VRVVLLKNLDLRTAIFSGNRNAYGDDLTGVHLRFRDNPSLATELRYVVDKGYSATRKTYPGSYSFGATSNLGPFYNVATNARSSGNYLIYFIANQAASRREAGSDRGLDVDFAYDRSPGDVARDYSQITGGLRYNGLIPRRRGDTIAVGLVYTRISNTLNQALVSAGELPFGSEKAFEVNYSLKVTRWFSFQPVYQRYFDTGANPQDRNSNVAGFRTSFNL
jgi:carbohydrate-selective porin OprB